MIDELATIITAQASDRTRDRCHCTGRAYVVTGLSFADALAGGAAAANQGAPLYTTPPQCLPTTVLDSITLRGASTIYILGGTSVLSLNVENLVVC